MEHSQLTCPCSSVVNTIGCHVQWSMTNISSRVQSSVQVHLLSTKELFLIKHDEQEIILGRK